MKIKLPSMKFFNPLSLIILSGFSLQAQSQEPVQLINRQMTDYFSANPGEKIFDSSGNVVVQDLFRLNHGSASCDLAIPADLPNGIRIS